MTGFWGYRETHCGCLEKATAERAETAEAERDAALAERDALRAAMQGLEWQELPTASGKTNWFCPLCLRPRDGRVLYQSTERTVTTTHGHTDRCAMAAALGAPAAGQGA